MEIKFAKWQDVEDIIKVSNITHMEHFEKFPDDFPDPNEHSFMEERLRQQFPKKRFTKRSPSSSIFVCKNQGIIVGHIFFLELDIPNEGKSIYIMDISLLPKYRSKGIGNMLLQHLIVHGKSRGVRLFLGDVWLNNSASARLFESNRFSAAKTSYRLYNTDAPKAVLPIRKWGMLNISAHPIFVGVILFFIIWVIMLLNR